MSYKPNEKDWMAYLYDELEGEEKEKFNQYLLENEAAQQELERFRSLRKVFTAIEDKEIIAPPVFVGDNRSITHSVLWKSPYFKTIISIAASLLLIILVGKLTGIEISVANNEFKMNFARTPEKPFNLTTQPALTERQVQHMINTALQTSNAATQASWGENERQLTSSIRKNLAENSVKIDNLIRQASTASQEQIRQYAGSMQAENMQLVKDYFQLTGIDQKKYMENLLVDFAQYLQQQRENDIQLVQTRLNDLEQNTDLFKQETEQILTSIITTVGTPNSKEIRN